MSRKKIYRQWNGKNIDGQAELTNNFLAKEAESSNTSDMNYVVGVDTFSAEDLQ